MVSEESTKRAFRSVKRFIKKGRKDLKEPFCLVCGSTIEPEHIAKAVGLKDWDNAEEWIG